MPIKLKLFQVKLQLKVLCKNSKIHWTKRNHAFLQHY